MLYVKETTTKKWLKDMYHGILDSGAGNAFLAVFNDGRELFCASTPMRGREGAALPLWVEKQLNGNGLKLEDIEKWSVGAGPGSFTGLRLAAALVIGWCYGKKSSCRAVPGVFGVAAGAGITPNENICCLYDGRNREVIACTISCSASGKISLAQEPLILDAEKMREFAEKNPCLRYAALTPEIPAITKITPPGLEIIPVDAPQLKALAEDESPFDDDLTKLVYIRPAVYTK